MLRKIRNTLLSFTNSGISSLNTITLHRKNLLHNLSYLQSIHPESSIFPVLKSNAYGHGLKEVSMILKETNVPYICVDSFPEYQIVKYFAQKKSLILGETRPENYHAYDPRRATLAVYNIETLKILMQTNKKRTIHLFLNTGMNREGLQEKDLQEFLETLQKATNITLEGVISHFANADELDRTFDLQQIEKFKHLYSIIKKHPCSSSIHYRHINNSAGTAKYNDPFFSAHRAGLAFYGYSPLLPTDPAYSLLVPLQPALTVSTTIVALQELVPQELVSYGGKRTASEKCITATIPFGYYEGLSRTLTNNRKVKRNESYVPLIGTICMNLSCLDTMHYPLQKGDTIELISADQNAPNNIEQYAKKTGTIPYEVLVRLNEKIRRIIL